MDHCGGLEPGVECFEPAAGLEAVGVKIVAPDHHLGTCRSGGTHRIYEYFVVSKQLLS